LENLCILRGTTWKSRRATIACLIEKYNILQRQRMEKQMNKINWTVVAVVTIIALLIFQVVASLFGGWGYGGWGMMGRGMMGGWGFSPFGWIGMIFMWLIPVAFVVLAVLGIVWLARNVGGGTNSPTHACPSCGRNVQTDWRNCPYCGTSLSK